MPKPWRVEPLWAGETAFLVASGPSSADLDLSCLKGRRVLVINDNYLRCPFADLLYFCDWKWWTWHRDRPGFLAFGGLKVTMDERVAAADPTIHWVKNGDSGLWDSPGRKGLCEERDSLRTGRNSGYQAVNLAVHLGAARIVLIGYDMKPGPKGEEHWFGQHRDRDGRPVATPVKTIHGWAERFETMLPDLERLGVEVVNAGQDSAIACFERVSLDDCLQPGAPALRRRAS